MPKRSREASPTIDSKSVSSSASDNSTIASLTEVSASHQLKYVQTSREDHLYTAQAKTVMKCSLPPHSDTLSFSTFEDFEIHYAKAHANRCPECQRNLPTEHYLGLHIEENHDPLVGALRARGEKTVRIKYFIEVPFIAYSVF